MNALLPIGLAAGYVLLVLAFRADRRVPLDAFRALDTLRRSGPLRPPARFGLPALVAFVGGLLGVESTIEARIVVALLPAFVAYLAWLHVWSAHRSLVDAAIVYQDHVPPTARPVQAFSPAPVAALSFRPFAAASGLLAALVAAGVVLGFAANVVGVQAVAFVAAATFVFIGVTFAALAKRALDAERSFRRALRCEAEASDAELLEALRRNPRSSALLEAHADRLAASGHRAQALLEYRAAQIQRPNDETLVLKVSPVRDARPSPLEVPVPGSIVRLPDDPEPRMQLAPLELSPDAVRVRLLDARVFVRELLALPDEGLVVAVQGTFDAAVAEELEPYRHLSPLVVRDPGMLTPFFGAWRLEPGSRAALARYVDGRELAAEWRRFALFSRERLLVDGHPGLRDVSVDADLYAREYGEWRRAAAVASDVG